MSLNIHFTNCIDFINNTKKVVASDPTAFQNIYMENAIVHAECDLMEMEMLAALDAEEYDFIISTNVSRKGNNRKAKQNGKRNSTKANHLHRKDRKHGKHRELSRKEQDLVHYDATKGVHGAGVWYSSRGKKVVPVVSKGEKTNRNYYAKKYSQSADFKEKEYLEEMYTGLGDLLHDIDYFEEQLFRYKETISDMEHEKKWGYLTDLGEQYLEEYKEETVWLEQAIKENTIQYNTALR